MNVAFIACVERGYLESQTLLLCRSIRANAGAVADAAIHVFSPRRGRDVSSETIDGLRRLRVELHTDELNGDLFRRYGIGNKVVACAWAEEHLDADVLVFADSDTVFVDEPLDLSVAPGAVALRPVDTKNAGSTGPGDRHDPYWQRLYELCGVDVERYVVTATAPRRIRAYYNAGLVAVHRSTGLMRDWLDCLRTVFEHGHRPPGRGWTFADQVALAAATARHDEPVVLDPRYNYPLPKRHLLEPPWDASTLDDLVHIHYHGALDDAGYLGALHPPIGVDGRAGRWLTPHLPVEAKSTARGWRR